MLGIAEDVARELVDRYCPKEQHPGQWNTTQFLAEMNSQFGIDAKAAGADPASLNHDQLSDAAAEAVQHRYEEKEKQFSPDFCGGWSGESSWTWWIRSGKTTCFLLTT